MKMLIIHLQYFYKSSEDPFLKTKIKKCETQHTLIIRENGLLLTGPGNHPKLYKKRQDKSNHQMYQLKTLNHLSVVFPLK